MLKKRFLLLLAISCLLLVTALLFVGCEQATVTTTLVFEQDFDSIEIDAKWSNVVLEKSHDDKCYVEFVEAEKIVHSAKIDEYNRLKITFDEHSAWQDHLGTEYTKYKITVRLPKDTYSGVTIKSRTGTFFLSEDIKYSFVYARTNMGSVICNASTLYSIDIKTDTGIIGVSNISCGSKLSLESTSGAITVKNVQCEQMVVISSVTGSINCYDVTASNLGAYSEGSGSIYLENVRVSNSLGIKAETGTVRCVDSIGENEFYVETTTAYATIDRCDSKRIFFSTDKGTIIANLLSPKDFDVKNEKGTINFPENGSSSDGDGLLVTETGTITVTIAQ